MGSVIDHHASPVAVDKQAGAGRCSTCDDFLYCIKTSASPSGDWYVESWDGRVRPATPAECARLGRRTTYSPQVLENALKASHGVGSWRGEYDAIDYQRHRQAIDIEVERD